MGLGAGHADVAQHVIAEFVQAAALLRPFDPHQPDLETVAEPVQGQPGERQKVGQR